MPRRVPDHESLPVMVPRNYERLITITPDRVQRLWQHLQDTIRDLRKAKRVHTLPSRLAPAPEGFRAVVAQAACSLCKGYCCRNGGDDGFLDSRTIARVRLADPTMTDAALI